MWASRSKRPKPPTPGTPIPAPTPTAPNSSIPTLLSILLATTTTIRSPFGRSLSVAVSTAFGERGPACPVSSGAPPSPAFSGPSICFPTGGMPWGEGAVCHSGGCMEAMHYTGAHRFVLELASSAWTRCLYPDAPGQRHGQRPVSGTADPRVVKQDKSSRGSVDTTRQSSDPQGVGLSSGKRPVGAAKGKQHSTKALCQPPPPPTPHCQLQTTR